MAQWSKTHGCCWTPCTKENYDSLTGAVSDKAILKTTTLSAFLLNRKKQPAGVAVIPVPTVAIKPAVTAPPVVIKPAMLMSSESRETVRLFTQLLDLKAYSTSTIRTNTNELMQFLNTIGDNPATGFSAARWMTCG